jgi:hypothetical protein
MQIITELYHVESCESIMKENFINNIREWEIVNIKSETSEIKEGFYYMQNNSETNWNYYKTKINLKKEDEFLFQADIILQNKEDTYGHFGLVWGFDESHKYLNRFTLSADGKRALIMHFEKDHKRIYHRFQNRILPNFNTNTSIRFSIIKLGHYFHFFINECKIYTAHESIFTDLGTYIGYYIEPGLSIKSNFIEVKKIKSQLLDAMTGFNPITSLL